MSYCTPCPPCDTNFPLLCEPLETTANGKRLVVEDSAACQKTIQTPTSKQVLNSNNGNVEFATLNSVLQSGPVDLGSQPLTTTGSISSSVGISCKVLDVYNPTGPAGIEVGGVGTAFIDLKSPNPDDNDIRLGTNGTGGFLSTSNNGNIIIDPGTGSVGIATGTPNARFSVVKGANLFGSAEFIGTSETSFFHNSVDEHTYIRGGKTTSNVYLNDTATTGYTFVGSGGLIVGGAIASNSTILATGNSSKIGYTSGGSVTQAGAKTNPVTLNRPTGTIGINNAALAANTSVLFNLNNNIIRVSDLLLVTHISGGTVGAYNINAYIVGDFIGGIWIRNITGGSLSESLTLQFMLLKSAIA